MADVKDVVVTDPPKKGSTWIEWLTWAMRTVTVLAAAYAAWKSDSVSGKVDTVLPLVAATATK